MTLPPPECNVYTPSQLAAAMIQALEPTPLDYWLDPCIGPGAFVARLREEGISQDRIVGVDIDPSAGEEDQSATTVRGVDFFQWCTQTKQRFTKIVANPPYVAICKLHPDLRQSLISFGGTADASFAPRSNYWCAFLAASLRLLADKGNLAFVLPAAWDYAQYAANVRQAVLRQFQSVAIHRCMEPLFTHVREGCVVLVAKGYRGDPSVSVRIDHATSQGLISALTSGVALRENRHDEPTPSDGCLTSFSELYGVNIGCVTGDARYFLLTESDRTRLSLPFGSVRPVLSRARQLTTAYMTSAEWSHLLRADERVWLFSPTSTALGQEAVRSYLQHGEKVCNLAGYKLSRREPWYSLPDIRGDAIGFLSGMTKLGPWICFRSKRGLAATNTLYLLTSKTKMPMDERAAWALALLSSPVRRQYSEIARRYPDGLTKLEPHDIHSLRLPTPIRTKGARESYERAIDHLTSGAVAKAVAIANRFVELPCS
ncbi:MAG: N-6 DNA methylase [Acidobacteriales bacterium]|nr:N-6 DNA methylase [Terriglobales bacterium]